MDYNKLFDMTGKVCIVTGGMGYLGSQVAKCLKDFGATVAIADIRESEARWKDAEQAAGDLFVPLDIDSTDSAQACFRKVADTFGKVDVLVHCASFGAGFGKDSKLEFMSDDIFRKGLDGNLVATFRMVREAVPYMKEAGGSIVTFGSMYGVVAPDLRIYGKDSNQTQPANYGPGKAGIIQLTRYAAGALAEYGIRVNCIIPGPFPNPKSQADNAGFAEILGGKTMLGRVGVNHEIAGPVLLLASDAASFMTGSSITVDGGWTAW